MKKIIVAAVIIGACGALCALVWPQMCVDEEVPGEVAVSAIADVSEEPTLVPEATFAVLESAILAEKENRLDGDVPAITPEPAHAPEPTEAPKPTLSAATTVGSADPYRTDVYPENVYSEEYLYDTEGNLIGKATTIPTAFGPNTAPPADPNASDAPESASCTGE